MEGTAAAAATTATTAATAATAATATPEATIIKLRQELAECKESKETLLGRVTFLSRAIQADILKAKELGDQIAKYNRPELTAFDKATGFMRGGGGPVKRKSKKTRKRRRRKSRR